jgi:hypothetical protein
MTVAFGCRVRFATEDPQDRGLRRSWYGHWMRITEPKTLDDGLLVWLRESYHQIGMQERLPRR